MSRLGSLLQPSLPYCLWLGPLFGLYWSKGTALPTIMVGSLSLALLGVSFAGVLAQSFMDRAFVASNQGGRRAQPGIFQLLWFGQLLLFALVLLFTPLMATLADLTGVHVPLRLSLPFWLVALGYFAQRKGQLETALLTQVSGASVVIAALLAVALFRGMALHSFHAGALGHDTQQHIYWAEHIFDYGYLPFASRGSDLIEEYPRFFHLLAASWSAVGLAPSTGPFVKIMPLLQLTLTAGFVAELVLSAQLRATNSKVVALAPLVVGAFLAWHLTRGDAQGIMPTPNLSGTPRYSASWALSGLPLLVLAHRVGTLRSGRGWLLVMAPTYGALSAGINPVLAVVYVAFALPFSALVYALTMSRTSESSTFRVPLLVGGTAFGLLLVANPFVAKALARVGPVGRILSWAGVRVSPAGLDSSQWILPPEQVVPLCSADVTSCVLDRLNDAAQVAFSRMGEALSSGTVPLLPEGKHSLVYLLVFVAPALPLGYRFLRGAPRPSVDRSDIQLLAALCAATLLSSLPVLWIDALLSTLIPLGGMWLLLSGYFFGFPVYLSALLLPLLTLSSWLFMPVITLRPRLAAVVTLSLAMALFIVLSPYAPRTLTRNSFARPASRITWQELRAIDKLNAFVPKHEAVLVPARYHLLGEREHILTANTPLGLIASHLDTGLLFAFSLGTGKDYRWADLAQTFCGPSAEARSSLLRRARVRWVLQRAKKSHSRAHFDSFRWECGISLSDLKAEYPAAWHRRDLSLYRINP